MIEKQWNVAKNVLNNERKAGTKLERKNTKRALKYEEVTIGGVL